MQQEHDNDREIENAARAMLSGSGASAQKSAVEAKASAPAKPSDSGRIARKSSGRVHVRLSDPMPSRAFGSGDPAAPASERRATEGGDAARSGGTGKHARKRKPRKQNFITRQVNRWCNRLLGAVSDRSFANQEEEFAAHRTTRDYVWNSIGIGAWGFVFPILTVVVTQISGAEEAGMFSMAFVTGLLLMFLANYGVRTYQVSDLDEAHSFGDYQVNRWITCAIMIVVGIGYCSIRGYGADMFTICMGVYVYKMIDGLADVYEGRLQQVDKLYLAGISQAFRSVVVLIVFCAVLLVTRNVPAASVAMGVAAVLTFLVLTLPLALFETPQSARPRPSSIIELFQRCFPLFLALFLYQLIDNMPKFVMEGVLDYDNQLYYNALYFPAHAILLAVGLIYKPLLVRMAEAWADPARRRRFDLTIVVMVLVTVAITVATGLVMNWIGIPVMSFLYGLDFEQFRGLALVMVAAGGVTAAIEFLYQVITVLRRQKAVTRLYLITFGFSIFVPVLLVNFTGLPGAVIGYLIVMCILLVLLTSEYISIRIDLRAKLTGVPTQASEMPTAAGASSGLGKTGRR